MVRIIGLDPGLRHTGWGVVDVQGNHTRYVGHGVVTVPANQTMAERLNEIFQKLEDVLREVRPDEAAVEETFVNKNPLSTLKLGAARGVVMVSPARFGIPVFEYAANRVKKAVVGVGHANKDQIALMIRTLLPAAGTVTLDAADALAVALCHAHYRTQPTLKTTAGDLP